MPGSDDGADYQQVGEKQEEEDQVSRQSSKEQIGKEDKREEPDDEAPPRAAGGYDASQNQGGGSDRIPWSKPLQILCLVTLGLSLLLMIIITASRSWGIGKYLDHDLSAGLFTICSSAGGQETCQDWGYCPDAKSQIAAAGAFAIMTILLLVVMFLLQLFEFLKPAALGPFPMIQTILHHVLWFFLLLCWALWAGKHNSSKCWDHMWYAWGWMFTLWMWLVHMFIAVLLTMKVFCGKPLPCGL